MSLEKALHTLYASLKIILPNQLLENFAKATIEDLHYYHSGVGVSIRNNLLHSGSKLYGLFMEAGISHKDDMSVRILNGFHQQLNQSD